MDKLAVKWSVNLFRIPRGGIQVGDVFVVQKRILDQWDRLANLYQPKLELPEPASQPVGDMDQVEWRLHGPTPGSRRCRDSFRALGFPPSRCAPP